MKDKFARWINTIYPWLEQHGIKILIILICALILYKIFSKLTKKVVRIAIVSDTSMTKMAQKKREDTLVKIFTWTMRLLLISISALMLLQEIGVPVAPILASAGIVGLAVGFGGQYLIRDIISGFFIILENQYRIGDVVNFDGTAGLVEDISLRMTTLRDLDGIVYHVPHGEIKKVANLTKVFSRVNLNIGVAYETDIGKLEEIVNEVGNEIAADSQFKDSVISAPQFVRIDDFADSAIVIKIIGETIPLKQWEITGEMRKRLKIAFDREGIVIPFPQRVVHVAG
ncbi:MAG: mechanosensitive ion channel family protein [Ferruginibacter sp.]